VEWWVNACWEAGGGRGKERSAAGRLEARGGRMEYWKGGMLGAR